MKALILTNEYPPNVSRIQEIMDKRSLIELYSHAAVFAVIPFMKPSVLSNWSPWPVKSLCNPELCKEMGKKGRKRAEEIFSWKSIAERTFALYRSLKKSFEDTPCPLEAR